MEPPSIEREHYSEEFLFLFPVSPLTCPLFLLFSAQIFACRAFAVFEIFALALTDHAWESAYGLLLRSAKSLASLPPFSFYADGKFKVPLLLSICCCT
jgi:hypothetical protein